MLSSVYLFYDPAYEHLSPGTFAAVREIEYTLRVKEVFAPAFKYYYMGLYFQDCQKSVYKASYKPSQVLCPHTYNWVYLTEEVKERITKTKWAKLCDDKPIIKVLDFQEAQLRTLAKNFKFYKSDGRALKIGDLIP